MISTDVMKKMLDDSAADFIAYERAWLPHDRRGRWLVMEAGAGRYLKNSFRDMRRYVDAITPRRARRFSSLSHARAFARQVGGTLHHWRRTPPSGGIWKRETPWERAIAAARVTRLSLEVAK